MKRAVAARRKLALQDYVRQQNLVTEAIRQYERAQLTVYRYQQVW
jgi:hypothetical protein